MAQFGRHQRILTGRQYKAVFDNRLRFHGRFFSFHLMPNGLAYYRLGLAVSKKVSKLAVQRNRIKRQARDSFRHFQQQQIVAGGNGGIDIIVVAKPSAAVVDNGALREELGQMWQKAASLSATRLN